MGTGVYIKCFFMATQPCHTANGNWGVHQYLHGFSALSHCKWVLGIASISSWLLSPVTLQMGTGDCINIFMATQPCNAANGYWGLHQYFTAYTWVHLGVQKIKPVYMIENNKIKPGGGVASIHCKGP